MYVVHCLVVRLEQSDESGDGVFVLEIASASWLCKGKSFSFGGVVSTYGDDDHSPHTRHALTVT